MRYDYKESLPESTSKLKIINDCLFIVTGVISIGYLSFLFIKLLFLF